MSTSASLTPSGNGTLLQQNSDWKKQHQPRLSGTWTPSEVASSITEEQLLRSERTSEPRNCSPKKCPRKSDDGSGNGNAPDAKQPDFMGTTARDSTVHLNVGGYPEVVLDGGKKQLSAVIVPSAEKEFDAEGQSLVETVRTGGDDDDPDALGECCGGEVHTDGMVGAVGRFHSRWIGNVEKMQVFIHGTLERNSSTIITGILLVLVVFFYAYLAFAVWYYVNHETNGGVLPIVAMTAFVMVVLLIRFISKRFGNVILFHTSSVSAYQS